MADDDIARLVRDAIEDDASQTNRIARWHRLLMAGVGLFTTRYGRLPDRDEVRQIGEICTRIEIESNQPKALH